MTHTAEAYEALALALAQDPQRLAAIRARLEANRLGAPLFDLARYRRHIEAAFLRMMAISDAGGMPQNFAVGD